MKRSILIVALVTITLFIFGNVAIAAQADKPPLNGHQYTLNIIGFAQCTKTGATDPDCFNGNAGDIQTNGHTIFVPLKMTTIEGQICGTSNTIPANDADVTTAELKKGVRILVTDAYGDDLQVIDRDATDGTARLNLPDGCYEIYARPLGKPNGCMDIDTIICYVWNGATYVQTNCDPNLPENISGNDVKYVLVGHLDVDRSTGRPQWTNATDELLPTITGVGSGDPGYFDFFWQIYNDKLRLAQLRIYEVSCSP